MQRKMSWINWKLIVTLSFILFILIGLIYFITLYTSIQSSKVDNKNLIEEKIYELTNLTEIEKVYEFHDTKAYYIILGLDDKMESHFVFSPLQDDIEEKDLLIYPQNDFVGIDRIETEWQETCEQCELVKSQPAMIEETPLWELVYKDEKKRYVITYITLEDGAMYEQIKLTRKYNKG